MSNEHRVHLGFNIYYGNQKAQNHFLVHCLRPAIEEARREFPLRFWFDRFDARGPHIFLLVTVPGHCREEARSLLSVRFSEFFDAGPNPEPMGPEEARARHEGCKGKGICEVDREAGMAEDNSYRSFEQPPHGYPFFLTRSLDREEELWRLLDDQASWTISQLAETMPKPATARGILWLAAFDRLLAAKMPQVEEYWSYHAGTLLLSLSAHLAENEQDVYRRLPGSIGARNRQSFESLWGQETSDSAWPDLSRLLDCVVFDPHLSRRQTCALLREIVHTTLKQLGIATQLHVPLLLFAWSLHLPPSHPPDEA
jgi:hypothetical protein